jgi:hypothetical protein
LNATPCNDPYATRNGIHCPACIPYTTTPAPLTDADKRCKCAAHNSDECVCGAWDDLDPQRLRQERDEARAEGKRMRETIQRYGHHDGYCDLRNYGRAVPVPCQCGFDAALSPAPAPEVCVWTGGGGAARNYKSGCMSYYWWESVPASGVCTWCGKPIEIKEVTK